MYNKENIYFLIIKGGKYNNQSAGVQINYKDTKKDLPNHLRFVRPYIEAEFTGFTPVISPEIHSETKNKNKKKEFGEQWVYSNEMYDDVLNNDLKPTKKHPEYASNLDEALRLLTEHVEICDGVIKELPLTSHSKHVVEGLKKYHL